MFGGAEEYLAQGRRWVRYFRESCGLEPHEHVLDVGCGMGRIAIPLAGYLTPPGRYDGLELIPARVEWCERNITPRWPSFQFHRADVLNAWVNPAGKPASEYEMPFPDGQFDFAFLISVFSHMVPADLENYLSEVSRVLKRGGRCLITMLLLNEDSLELLEQGKSLARHELPHDFGHYRLATTENPGELVAYMEDYILDLYARCGLEVSHPVEYGGWSGRVTSAAIRQDRVLAYRR
jgi:SAM-dependent methyltransferase